MIEAETKKWLESWGVKAKEGDVVRFLGEGGYEYQLENAKRILEDNKEYVISGFYADSWGVHYYLEGIPNKTFPEDMFEHI